MQTSVIKANIIIFAKQNLNTWKIKKVIRI
jgi:hypothetical protein